MLAILGPPTTSSRSYSVPFDDRTTASWQAESWSDGATVQGDAITLHGNNRLYLKDDRDYLRLDLRSQTLRFTVDLSQVRCSCNAAVYLVAMTRGCTPLPAPGDPRTCDS